MLEKNAQERTCNIIMSAVTTDCLLVRYVSYFSTYPTYCTGSGKKWMCLKNMSAFFNFEESDAAARYDEQRYPTGQRL